MKDSGPPLVVPLKRDWETPKGDGIMNSIRRLPPAAELIRLFVELHRARGSVTLESLGVNGPRLLSFETKFGSDLEGCFEPSCAMGAGLAARALHHRSPG